jgi:stringent starvation protein B
VKDGRIVLNVAERAVAGLQMSNDVIRFSARFGGVSHTVSVPVSAVLAIYARETGQGMALPEDVTGGAEDAEVAIEEEGEDTLAPSLSAVPSDPAPDDDNPSPPSPRRSGHLRIVK